MSVELIKRSLVLNRATKREYIQVIKERDLIVPDGKPDMQKVLQMDGKLEIDQMEVQQDRIVYKGKVEFAILYVPENDPTAIYTMKGTLPLEDFIIMEGVNKDHSVKLTYTIEHLHWNVLNERKVNVKVIIQLGVHAIENQEAEVVVDCSSNYPVQTKKQEICFCKKGNRKEEKMVVKDDLTVPSGKPNIREVLKVDIQISDEEFKRTNEEIFFSGNLNISTLYRAQTDEEQIEMMFHQIPFSSAIEYVREEEEESYNCLLDVAQQYVQVIPDLDGEDRILETEIIVKVEASNACAVREHIVDDMYCPGKNIQIKDVTNDFVNLLHNTTICIPKKETIMFEGTAPDNECIYSIHMKPIVEEKNIRDGRLEISGMIETTIMYITQEATEKLAYTNAIIPFTHEVEIQGINRNTTPVVVSRVSDIRLLTQGKREAVVEFKLCNMMEMYGKQPLYMIQDVELSDIEQEELKKVPSMVIYTVKKEDSFWDIAKKYNTTLQEITELNELEPNGSMCPGQKIMILKKPNY